LNNLVPITLGNSFKRYRTDEFLFVILFWRRVYGCVLDDGLSLQAIYREKHHKKRRTY